MSADLHRQELRWMESVMERVREAAARHRKAFAGGDPVDMQEYGRLFNSIQRIDHLLVLIRKQRTDSALAAVLDVEAALRKDAETDEDKRQHFADVDHRGLPPVA